MRNITNQVGNLASRAMGAPLSRTFFLIVLLGISLPMVGCDILGSSVKVSEIRTLSAPAVTGQSLRVNTVNGRVSITVDETRQDINIEAAVTTTGNTTEEADNRLKAVTVIVKQADGNVLDISVDYGPDGRKSSDSCSFTITLPSVSGVSISTSNGAIHLTNTTGAADLHTSNGAVVLRGHNGAVTIKTSNGTIKMEDISGKVDAQSSNGSITYAASPDNKNSFLLHTSNGSIYITVPKAMGGRIKATTSNGSVNINTIPENTVVSGDKRHRTIVLGSSSQNVSEATTSNGSINLIINP